MIVIATADAAAAGEIRPFLVVQSDLFNESHATISMCPITNTVTGNHLFRVSLERSPDTGLTQDGEIQADKIQRLPRDAVARVIGAAPITTMTWVDDALRRWLEL